MMAISWINMDRMSRISSSSDSSINGRHIMGMLKVTRFKDISSGHHHRSFAISSRAGTMSPQLQWATAEE
jgi:hypothetical protein